MHLLLFSQQIYLMKVHFIAIGGSIMHNLAIALHEQGHEVTGSDDEIFDPAKSRLKVRGLLPPEMGWDPDRIYFDLDAVIVGMHARKDNPELKRAQELKIPIYSFPQFVAEQAKRKQRVVIAGSHGKTTVTSMIMHVLQEVGKDFDYLVGAPVAGFENSVKLTEEAPIIIIEGDEYLTSALDQRPKFLWYGANIAVITGIAWDHMNVFKTEEEYIRQFEEFIHIFGVDDTLIYNSEDETVEKLVIDAFNQFNAVPYSTPEYEIKDDKTHLKAQVGDVELKVFGKHNLANIQAAHHICQELGVEEEDFYRAISSFAGAGGRMEEVGRSNGLVIYRDFAHAPSKVRATVKAVKEQFPERKTVAVLELHTYSSLNPDFIPQYKGALDGADVAHVLVDPHAAELKKLRLLEEDELKTAFGKPDLHVHRNADTIREALLAQDWHRATLLFMSSGNFSGLNVKELSQQLLKK